MRLARLFSCLAALSLASCSAPARSATRDREAKAPSPLVGVWRVARFCDDDDATGRIYEPYGPAPSGFFIYTAGGRLAIQIARPDAIRSFARGDYDPSPSESRAMLDAYMGYYGTYEVTSDSTVVHRVQGGTVPSFIATEQPRVFAIRGDTLRLGGSRRTWPCRVLLRVE